MAAPQKGKPAAKGAPAKGAPKKAKGKQAYQNYENGKAKNRSCPKCGAGTFLAEHKDRRTCGKCNYMEKK